MNRIPVWRGEFGLLVRYHVPAVYAMGDGLTVEIEEGNEALYPRAAEWEVVPRLTEKLPEDSELRGALWKTLDRTLPQERFLPRPHKVQDLPNADVVIAPRKRHYGPNKNWGCWPDLARMLKTADLSVFAAGVADASDRRVSCPSAWEYGRPLDAGIQALRGARLAIATDAGVAHLAVLCGTPLLLITYRGLVAPGPVIAAGGKRVADRYWPVRFKEYYEEANHRGSAIVMVDGWENPRVVADTARAMLSAAAVVARA